MPASIIQKRSDPAVLSLKKIRDGHDRSLVFCEGTKLVEELLASQWKPIGLYCTREHWAATKKMVTASKIPAVPIRLMSDAVMEFCSDLSTPPGIIAIAKPSAVATSAAKPGNTRLSLVVHGVQLPQNVGALLRTAEGAGVSDVYVTSSSADAWGPKALRGSSGSAFRMPIRRISYLNEAIEQLKSDHVKTLAATQNGSLVYDEVDWSAPTALVLGSEGSGFTKEELATFDQTIRIPMLGHVESLNVGNAAAICLFEAARQRRHGSQK